MTVGRRAQVHVPGHRMVLDGAPHDEHGTLLPSYTRDGRCRCTCGLLSGVLPSILARRRWQRIHREELAGVPWSDAAMNRRDA